jgi:exoribonuclease II
MQPDLAAALRPVLARALAEHGLRADSLDDAGAGLVQGLPPPRDDRDRPWLSIDNASSQDLDQLSCVEPQGGGWRLHVAIADVAAHVAQGGVVDGHAEANTTTVYTDAGLVPMLPLRLSHGLSSLLPEVDRLALVISLDVDAGGVSRLAGLSRAWVRSRAKLVYEDVAAWLDGRGGLVVDEVLAVQLRAHDAVATLLHAARQAAGALLLDTPDIEPVHDASGQLVDWAIETPNRAQGLIAEIMVAANVAVAGWMREARLPHLVRVLPRPQRWPRLVQLAASFGHGLTSEPDAPSLAAFLRDRRAAAPEDFTELSQQVVKLLGGGGYAFVRGGDALDPDRGHFALALDAYVHTTAPNRRFADLIAHRTLWAHLSGAPAPYADGDLERLARHCTRQESAAAKVARQVRKAAMALMLRGREGDCFDAWITGASSKGVYVRTRQPLVEGRLVEGGDGLDVGDRLRVRLLSLDAEAGHIDFARHD